MNIMKKKLSAVLALSLLTATVFAFNDGLKRSTPEDEGVDPEVIAEFFEGVESSGQEVHSIMILRHDKVIAEHWWSPYAPELPHAMYSCTKTFTSMAVGFAVQEGLISIEDKVISFFPDLLPETISPELESLTVKHLLTMSVGHKSMSYPGSGLPQVKSFLAAEFQYEPGTHFAYNITASHMLSNIISRVTGMSIKEYLTPRLLDPIGIGDVVWEMDNDGHNMGNGGMHLRTSDMAKMGIFLNDKGSWNGKQLLNREWIEAATTPHIYQVDPSGPVKDAKDDSGQGYGYQIWMGRNGSYRAIGGMNQLIMVFPDKDFIVIATSALRDEAGFNDLVYKMLPGVGDKKLKPVKGFDMESRIGHLALAKPYQHTAKPLTSCTRRYEMAQNQLGISRIGLRFDAEGNAYLTIEGQGSISNIPFGIKEWKIGQTDRTMMLSRSAYPNTMGVTPYNTAGMCAWSSQDVLEAEYISLFNPGMKEDFKFTFAGDTLKLEVGGVTLSGYLSR